VEGILTRKGKKRDVESGAACVVISREIVTGAASRNGAVPTA